MLSVQSTLLFKISVNKSSNECLYDFILRCLVCYFSNNVIEKFLIMKKFISSYSGVHETPYKHKQNFNHSCPIQNMCPMHCELTQLHIGTSYSIDLSRSSKHIFAPTLTPLRKKNLIFGR